jgi:hypothetical protein
VTIFGWLQASAAKYIRAALFWVITQQVAAIHHRRFGTTYRFHLQWSAEYILKGQDPWSWDRQVVPKRRQEITTNCWVVVQRNAVLISITDTLLQLRPRRFQKPSSLLSKQVHQGVERKRITLVTQFPLASRLKTAGVLATFLIYITTTRLLSKATLLLYHLLLEFISSLKSPLLF